jgi:tetratricopeptide (TPR) repeat protein
MSTQDHIDVQTLALLSKSAADTTARLDHQDRTQANATLTIAETIRGEATEVIKMIQHKTVQTRTRSLSIHSQVEPAGFNSLTTRVRLCLLVHRLVDPYRQVAVNITSSLVTFSILSPDASLSYDQIKMRLDEYSEILISDSLTVKFITKHGKTILCRKQVSKMEKQLQEAKDLLQAMIESRDVPTVEAIHRLCDLSIVLDQLKLQEECLVVGDCTIKLAQALGSQGVGFQKEQAATISLIAGLGVYQSRACPLFIQAISICEAFVIEDSSDSAKVALVRTLGRAGSRVNRHDALCAQWLDRAINLIAELPLPMVTDSLRGSVYFNYGVMLDLLKEYRRALAAGERAVAFYHSLVSSYGGSMYKEYLAKALYNCGHAHSEMGHLEEALRVQQEAISLFRTLAADGQDELKGKLADALHNCGITHSKLGHLEDVLIVRQEAVSLYRTLVADGHDELRKNLADALYNCGKIYSKMDHLEDALSVRQEAVSLFRTLIADGQDELRRKLADALHNCGITYSKMGRLEDALSIRQEAVSLYRTLVADGHDDLRRDLADALYNCGRTYSKMGQLEDALSVRQEASSLYHMLGRK